jgi:integrase
MAKRNLSERFIKALKPAPNGKRVEHWDAVVPGLGIRTTDRGVKTFVLIARYPGSANPTRRALGEYGAMSLEEARDKARKWLSLLHKGKNPATIEEIERRASVREQANTFGAAAEEFIRYIHRQKLRTAPEMERGLRQTFIARWDRLPMAEITSGDIRGVIAQAVSRDAPYTAFKLFSLIRRFFNWAIGADAYGLEQNPCWRLNPKDLIGERHARHRVLDDCELQALWRITARVKYPWGPLYRALMLTGLRLNEACGARWGEIDAGQRLWTIPAERMKKVKGGAKPHVVPLSSAMIDLLDTLPRFAGGDHLFSHSYGKRPLRPHQFSDFKTRLDRRLLRTLRAMARLRGQDPAQSILPPWVNHDLRRTFRTRLSALKIPDEVREAVLAHQRPGIKGVYDHHHYLDEKREALDLWDARLRSIVES